MMKLTSDTPKAATILSWVFAGILILLPFHALLTTWIGSNTGHLDLVRVWKEVVIAVICIPAAWLVLKSPDLKKRLANVWIFKLIGVYFALHLVLGWHALTHHQLNKTAWVYALIINLRFLIFFTACYVLASQSTLLKRNWRTLLLWPAGLVIIFGLLQKFALPHDFLRHFGYGPDTIPATQTVDSDINYQRIQSTLRGANPLGAYLVLIIPALLFIRSNTLKITSLASAGIVLFYSYSRSAWLGLIASLLCLAIWKSGGSRRLKELVLVLGILILMSGLGIYTLRSSHAAQNTFFHTNYTSANVSSNAQRASAIKHGLQDVIDQPFGRGPGTAGPASYRNSGHEPRIAENYFLQIGQEIGLAGIAIFIAINLLVARQLWLIRRDKLAALLLASLVGITFINLVSHAWTDDTLSFLWWGLAGIALAPAILSRRHKQNGQIKKTTA